MVNTFILTNSPKTCVKLLDMKRLGKQRVEAYQIINVLENFPKENEEKIGWSNHPIVKMWKDNIIGLKYYFNCAVDEWIFRGYKNNMLKYTISNVEEKEILPWFYYNEQLQMSHKMSLLRKDPNFYSSIFNKDEEYYNTGYIWTCNLSNEDVNEMKLGHKVSVEKICSDLGTGTPSHFRYTKDEVELWKQNKTLNPKTKRKIKETGNIYIDLEKAEKYYINK